MPTKKASTKKDTLIDKVVLLGSSLAYLTRGATNELIDTLEKNKVISTKDGKVAVEHVKAQIQERQSHVQKHVASQLSKVIDQLGIATKKDIEVLKKSQKKTTKSKIN